MIRKLSMMAPLLLLAACGSGGEQAGNTVTGDDAPDDAAARSYEGDNLTSIDAAANDASIQPLAPDTPVEAEAVNTAATAE